MFSLEERGREDSFLRSEISGQEDGNDDFAAWQLII